MQTKRQLKYTTHAFSSILAGYGSKHMFAIWWLKTIIIAVRKLIVFFSLKNVRFFIYFTFLLFAARDGYCKVVMCVVFFWLLPIRFQCSAEKQQFGSICDAHSKEKISSNRNSRIGQSILIDTHYFAESLGEHLFTFSIAFLPCSRHTGRKKHSTLSDTHFFVVSMSSHSVLLLLLFACLFLVFFILHLPLLKQFFLLLFAAAVALVW